MYMNQIIEKQQIVDLGLSSKWSTCNLGASSPEEYGDYYAWGELEPKSSYDINNYKWFSKNLSNRYGMVGDSARLDKNIYTQLVVEDDVTHLMLGSTWRMPSIEDIRELYEKCDWIWTKMNGINGCKITSMVKGYEDSSMFLPAAGCICKSIKMNFGSMGYYWSSAIYKDNSKNAIITTFDCRRRYKHIPHPRYYGLPIRPVCD